MEPKQRVNIFAEQRNGETFYRSGTFSKKKTVKDVMYSYGLSIVGVDIYANSVKVEPDTLLENLKSGNVCFLSCIYGEQKLVKRSKQQ